MKKVHILFRSDNLVRKRPLPFSSFPGSEVPVLSEVRLLSVQKIRLFPLSRLFPGLHRVLTALQGLDEGEVSDVIDTDTDYYVVRLDEKTDADATETTPSHSSDNS